MSNHKLRLRQDSTTIRSTISLPAHIWSILQTEQEELAEKLRVADVSRPVALVHILEQYQQHKRDAEPFCYVPDSYDLENADSLRDEFCYVPSEYECNQTQMTHQEV